MAKTDAELRDYFKQIANRNDWTQEDFLSARKETHDILDQIDFLVKSISYISTASDAYLSGALTRINQIRSALNAEIARRNT